MRILKLLNRRRAGRDPRHDGSPPWARVEFAAFHEAPRATTRGRTFAKKKKEHDANFQEHPSLVERGVVNERDPLAQEREEANVYLVASEGFYGVAKVYKDAQSRSFKNRAAYTRAAGPQ